MFTRLGCDGRPPRFRVEFYPYSSLVLTIRYREDAVCVRFSDLLQRAPRPVLEGAAALLLARVYRRKPPRELIEPGIDRALSGICALASHAVPHQPYTPEARKFQFHAPARTILRPRSNI